MKPPLLRRLTSECHWPDVCYQEEWRTRPVALRWTAGHATGGRAYVGRSGAVGIARVGCGCGTGSVSRIVADTREAKIIGIKPAFASSSFRIAVSMKKILSGIRRRARSLLESPTPAIATCSKKRGRAWAERETICTVAQRGA